MPNKIKLTSLRVEQINKLLQSQGASIIGNKSAKIAKLIELLNADEVDAEDIEVDSSAVMYQHLNDMRTMIQSLTVAIAEMTKTQQTLCQTVSQSMSTTEVDSTAATVARPTAQLDENARAESRSISGGLSGENTSTAEPRNWSTKAVQELIGLLPEFDPLKGGLTSEMFVNKVTQLTQTFTWTDREILLAVQSKLKGVAKDWVDAQPVFSLWQELMSGLLRDFPTRISVAEVHRDLAKRKRKYNESFKEFYYAMLNTGRKGNLDEQSIISYIITGLNDSQVSRTLEAMNLSSCTGLLHSLENLSISTPNLRNALDAEKRTSNFPDGSKEKDVKQVKCFNCNERGHISASCPQPQRKQRCEKCKKVGHTSATCQMQRSTVAKLETTALARYYGERTPPMMKTVSLWGHQFSGFLDTGSDSSLLAENLVPYEVKRKSVERKLEGFGGAVINILQAVDVELTLDGERISAEILLVPSTLMPYELLIGRNIICRAGCQLVIDSGVLKVMTIANVLFKVDEALGESDRSRVINVLNEFLDCFAEDISQLGRCKTAAMEIKVNTEQPIVGKRYTVAFSQRPVLSNIVEKLEKYGIIRPSESPHAAPVVLVKKSNGEDRMCVDYRALNAVTERKHFPMPIVEEQLARLSGKCFYTTLDMTAGYYQVPIVEQSKKYTAFITPDGLYEHNVMPFGLVNAPMVFQQMVTDIIKRLRNRSKIVSYVDEVIIAVETVTEGIEVLTEFLEAVREAGLTLRPSKCHFMATKVDFLGHVISYNCVRPGQQKSKCISSFARPRSATEVRQFLGLTGFFRKFIANYGTMAKPLTTLLRKGISFDWSAEHEKAFVALKEALIKDPVLAIFCSEREHEVHTDASAIGLSGVMLQLEDDGWKPVHYFSRQCSAVESTYPSHELEVLAIVETLERLRVYLLGSRFTIVTDCNAVATTKATTQLKTRIARWWLRLQEFDFTCRHRAGSMMQHVDSLSRAPVEPAKHMSTVADQVFKLESTNTAVDWVYGMQMQDEKLQNICKVLSESDGVGDTVTQQIKTDYEMCNNRLFRKINGQLRLVVPRAVRWRVTKSCHDDVGHFALEKTIKRIEKHFWFHRIRRYVKSYIASCEECCINKAKGGKSESEMHLRDVLPIPFRSLFIDHMGPFMRSKRGNSFLLVIVCGFSKYVILKATRSTKTEPVIKAVEETMSIFGQPMRITTDRGTAFTSRQFQGFVDQYGIQHVKVAVRTPRANGQVERANRTVLVALKCMVKDSKDWDTHLSTLQWSLNSQRNEVTKHTPNELVLQYCPRDVTHNRLIQALHDEEVQPPDADHTAEEVAENIRKQQLKWKDRYDKAHLRPRKYSVGDLVLIENVPSASGQSKKLEPAFKGPYSVTKVLDHDRYVIEDLPDAGRRHYSSVHSADHMKPWCCLNSELDDAGDSESSEEEEVSGKAEL